ncbi:MAG: ice-binding family protein [Thermoplasmata archaeon]|nr:ice-binding family protein [Thermoplasmata archaeon]
MALVEENGIAGKRTVVGSRLGKRADHARYWPAILISMIVVPMMVVLGFNAIGPAAAYASPPTVDLGAADNYVILAASAITATAGTYVTGDLGISPAAASDMTGFGLVLDGLGTFSTSSIVSGSIYASDYASPTPSNLITAVSNMMAAYNDSANRITPDEINSGAAGDIEGLTIVPGLYNWTTGVQVSTGSVTFSGTASDIWILQINGGLTLASGTAVALIGGADPAHIFWQVSGQVTLETTSVMKGIILCKTAIVMNNGATLEGRALAQTAVTMDANAVAPPGTTPVNPIPEFSQILIPLVGMVFVVAIVSKVRNQKK